MGNSSKHSPMVFGNIEDDATGVRQETHLQHTRSCRGSELQDISQKQEVYRRVHGETIKKFLKN